MSHAKLTGKQTELMDIADLLMLGTNDVELFAGFQLYPECIAVGTISECTLPDPENDFFGIKIDIAQVIELLHPETDGEYQLPEGANISQRYNKGAGIQAMMTAFEPTISALGNLGGLIANGPGMQVTFRITQRKVHERDKDRKIIDTKIYNGLADVTPC